MLKRMIAMGFLTVAMGGLGVACGGEEGGDACSSDNDCKGDRICDGGECVSPGGSNNTSNTSSNTPNNAPTSNSPNNTPTSNSPNNTPTSNAPNNTPNNTPTSNAPNNDSGSLGSDCSSGSDCDSEYCRKPAGGFDGECAVNDFGEMCEGNADCEYGACLFENPDVDIFGYCTTQCESFTDCPTFWDCDEVGNASGTYCLQD